MADMVPQGTQLPGESVDVGHEKADANMRTVFISVTVILTSAMVTMVAMAGMFNYLNNREKAKDRGVPDAFAVRQLPPGPPLLPSPKRDELPWAAYQNERRQQEAEAAKYGIINQRTGAYQPPGRQLEPLEVTKATERYFKSKPQWEQTANTYIRDTTGGYELNAAKERFGHNGSAAPAAYRPGENRPASEVGPAQVSGESSGRTDRPESGPQSGRNDGGASAHPQTDAH